jgi:hypothetical protein
MCIDECLDIDELTGHCMVAWSKQIVRYNPPKGTFTLCHNMPALTLASCEAGPRVSEVCAKPWVELVIKPVVYVLLASFQPCFLLRLSR